MNNVFRTLIVTTIFLCLAAKSLHSVDRHENQKTLMILAMQSADTFAKDPRQLDNFLETCPTLKNNTYFRCVKNGFAVHPELGKPVSTLNVIKYNLGLSYTVPSRGAYFDALKIQFGCLKPVVTNIEHL